MPLAVAVVASVVLTLLVGVAALFLWLYKKLQTGYKSKEESFQTEESIEVPPHDVEFNKLGKNVKGLIVNEEGIDVLYLRKLHDGGFGDKFPKVVINPSYGGDQEEEEEKRVVVDSAVREVRMVINDKQVVQPPLPPLPLPPRRMVINDKQLVQPPLPPLPLPPRASLMSSQVLDLPENSPDPPLQPPPPPPPPPSQPRRPLAPIRRTSALLPPPSQQRRPPSIIRRMDGLPAAPPPPPSSRAKNSSLHLLKPPPAPNHSTENNPKSHAATGGPKKLKPLHWDKIAINTDHSLVWDEINDGSLRFDDELMETLFAYTNGGDRNGSARTVCSSSYHPTTAPSSQIFILDPRKSQNAAIVLKSIGVSRREIIDALLEGEGLNIETLEKLNKMAPTHEEATRILQFNGNPTKLADAEAFLYHILKAVPSAFIRFKSMLFRLNYDSEILHLKESLQTLELGCKELRTRGLFLKLLEAILKAGNRMNAGTARGNAQGFNLTALGKIADIKSTDGKTTLLHFVVEQVVWSEGKRCANSGNPICSEDEKMQNAFLHIGLKQLESLNNDFSNVKKAAQIEYEGFINTSFHLSSCVVETRQVILSCNNGDQGGGFFRGMKEFLEGCDEELKVVKEEQVRVMELVRRTTEYYQAGAASRDKGSQPLQLFVLVKGFLNMVDRVRVDITHKKLQKKSTATANVEQSSPPPRFTGYTFGLQKGTFGIGSTIDPESDDDF